jgi:hypothetical protein
MGQSNQICAASMYRNPGDLCVILCLFNIGDSSAKLRNFIFCHSLIQMSGIPSIVVECAFGDDPWVLGASAEVIQMRTSTALWQKERLINCGLLRVPDRFTKVAWIDADIVFQDSDWAVRASELLDELAVVQLADRIIRLPRGSQTYTGVGQVWESFGAIYLEHPNAMMIGDFGCHGHTGFGWAARRCMLGRGIYDACIAGGGDHVMAHAFCGDWESDCLKRMMGPDTPWYRNAAEWASGVYPQVRARVGVVKGAALHLWHGDIASRRHVRRCDALRNAQFNPSEDLEHDSNGCWRWASPKPVLHIALRNYMADRRAEA